MKSLSALLAQTAFDHADRVRLLGLTDADEMEALRQAAYDCATAEVGDTVHYRGLVEVSNICARDCYYCGIRKGNRTVDRYTLSADEVIDSALAAAEAGYGSCVLQAGERQDTKFVDLIEQCISEIKSRSVSETLPQGLGMTLSLGEQTATTYQRWKAAGAHRYLLRIETTNPALFARLHPAGQSFERRLQALADLREAGFQVGTGVMIGLPGQTLDDLAADIGFFAARDVDMIGMGPYILAAENAMPEQTALPPSQLLPLALRMIAVTRLSLRNVNIAATTALEALAPNGREQGIRFGANVLMPNLTPQAARQHYQLYAGKPNLSPPDRAGMEAKIATTGRRVGWNLWGDSRHYAQRQG